MSVLCIFCKNDKISTCLMILGLAENYMSVFSVFCNNDKVSTCLVIIDLAKN